MRTEWRRTQKLLRGFPGEKTRFIVGSEQGKFGSCICKGFMKYSHNMPLTSPPIPTLRGGSNHLCTALPNPPLAFDAVVSQPACKEISGFTGTVLMGLPTNTWKSIARGVNLPPNDLIICYSSAVTRITMFLTFCRCWGYWFWRFL